MSGWFLIELSTFLLLCAIVLPLIRISIGIQRARLTPLTYQGVRAINQAMLIALVLGIPGILLEIPGILFILGDVNKAQSRPGWIFIGLGSFFLICTFLVPLFWWKLTDTLLGPSAELEALPGCAYTILIGLTLGLLSIILLIIGVLLAIVQV